VRRLTPDCRHEPFLVKFPEFPVLKPGKTTNRKFEGDSLKKPVEEFRQTVNEAIRPLSASDRRKNNISGTTIEGTKRNRSLWKRAV